MPFIPPLIASATAAIGSTFAAAAPAAALGVAATEVTSLAALTAGTAAASSGITLGTALQAGGILLSGIGTFSAASAQSEIAKNNAAIANQNAAAAVERSQIQQQDQDALTAAFMGEQLATMGASGISVDSDSFSKVRSTARRLGRQDALRVRSAGDFEAHAFQTQAAGFINQGRSARTEGTGSLLASALGAGSTLVGGARSTKKGKVRGLLG